MYFYNVETRQQLGYNQYSSATKYVWGPNGRVFLTARLHPIRRVENGYCLYDYCGNILVEQEYQELYQTEFRPAKPLYFSKRPASPTRKGQLEATRKSAYVPPHLRGKKNKLAAPKNKKNNNNIVNSQKKVKKVVSHL
eukprot:UN34558